MPLSFKNCLILLRPGSISGILLTSLLFICKQKCK
nr:MAG TPA: hypothetical protein [Caudoviricetes sp.]